MNVLFPFRLSIMRLGGVSIFNQSLIDHLRNRVHIYDSSYQVNVDYANVQNLDIFYRIKRSLVILNDIFHFNKKNIQKYSIDLVHLSPSLDKNSIMREKLYARKCIKYNVPFVTFIHGWNKEHAQKMEGGKDIEIFKSIFNKSEVIWVLAAEFKHKLIQWGFDRDKIIVETTMVKDELLDDFDIDQKINDLKTNDQTIQLLFLSRVVKEKGIYQAVDAFEILQNSFQNIKFIIAGYGPELKAVKDYVEFKRIQNIEFTGFIKGKAKVDILKNSHILLFPTMYGEGMPIVVLEAMAFGLSVVTRPAGGLKDIFHNGQMGYITEKSIPRAFAVLLEKIISNTEKMKKISRYNYDYAQKRLLASKVSQRIEDVYKQLLTEKDNT